MTSGRVAPVAGEAVEVAVVVDVAELEVADVAASARLRHRDAATLPLAGDNDLLATGWLDSLGFVDLLAFTEKTTGREIDKSTIAYGSSRNASVF